ncbi:hypothetical protein TNCV_954231 [Trichonephila clavipes]|nr:hypothetical protein TNCV_954231 [Trichonephila clavipes]
MSSLNGEVRKFGKKLLAQASFSLFDYGLKSRDPPETASARVASKCGVNNGSMKETATAGSDVVQSRRPIFDDFFQHLWPYIGNNTANVVFQMVKRLWLFRLDQ